MEAAKPPLDGDGPKPEASCVDGCESRLAPLNTAQSATTAATTAIPTTGAILNFELGSRVRGRGGGIAAGGWTVGVADGTRGAGSLRYRPAAASSPKAGGGGCGGEGDSPVVATGGGSAKKSSPDLPNGMFSASPPSTGSSPGPCPAVGRHRAMCPALPNFARYPNRPPPAVSVAVNPRAAIGS